MKKHILFNFKTVLYSLAIYFIHILCMSIQNLFFDPYNFQIRQDDTGAVKYIVIQVAILVISVACAAALRVFFSSEHEGLLWCGILFLADFSFKCTFFNFNHIVLLAVLMLVGWCFVTGKAYAVKTVVMAVLALVLPVINPIYTYEYLPIIIITYGYAMSKKTDSVPVASNEGEKAHKLLSVIKEIKELLLVVVLIVIGTIAGVMLKDIVSFDALNIGGINLFQNYVAVLDDSGDFVIGSLIYVIVLIVFVCSCFSAKAKACESGFWCAVLRPGFHWFAAVSLGLSIYGFIVKDLISITLFNFLIILIVSLSLLRDTESSRQAFKKISAFYRKNRFAVMAMAVIWFCLTLYIMDDVNSSLLDTIIGDVGERL